MLAIDASQLKDIETARDSLVGHYAQLATEAAKSRATYGIAIDCLDRIAVLRGILKEESLTAHELKLPRPQ